MQEVDRETQQVMEPRAFRPLFIEYSTIGYILRYEKSVYSMTPDEFVNCSMFYSHGAISPHIALRIYNDLMDEAGLNGT